MDWSYQDRGGILRAMPQVSIEVARRAFEAQAGSGVEAAMLFLDPGAGPDQGSAGEVTQ